jgi:cysteine desulfuration protein SufE
MTINEIQEEIIEEFSAFDDWMDKYQYLIDMGNSLEPLNEQYKKPQNIIEGCQSRVWLHASIVEGKVVIEAESDAVIVKGIVMLLIRVYSNRAPQEILDTDLYFIDEIGLKDHLSPTRANGLVSMIRQIRNYALAFKLKGDN